MNKIKGLMVVMGLVIMSGVVQAEAAPAASVQTGGSVESLANKKYNKEYNAKVTEMMQKHETNMNMKLDQDINGKIEELSAKKLNDSIASKNMPH